MYIPTLARLIRITRINPSHLQPALIGSLILASVLTSGCGKTLTGIRDPGPLPQPRPVLSSVSPTIVLKNTPAVVMTVTGTNFQSTTQIKLSGQLIASRFVSSSVLTANIPDSIVARPANMGVMVYTPPPGGGDSNELSFSVLPAPVLSTIHPAVVMAGNPEFTLTVSGEMFTPQSVIRFNGTNRNTTFVDGLTLRTTIPAAEVGQENAAIPVTVYEPLVQGTTQTVSFRVMPPPDTPAAAQSISRISVAADGTQANDYSTGAAITDSSRYAVFASYASNLVPGDANGISDVFLRDTCSGASNCTVSITRVSSSNQGTEATFPIVGNLWPAISGNGRILAYERTLSTGTGQRTSIALYDTCIGVSNCSPTTTSLNTIWGGEPNGDTSGAALSADGRYLAFSSNAMNLLDNDPSQYPGVYLYDMCTGVAGCTPSMIRVSRNSSGGELNGHSYGPSISGNGRYIAFASTATNVDGGSGLDAVYLRDTCVGTYPGTCSPATTRLSVMAGMPISTKCLPPALSRDAALIAFACDFDLPGPTPTYVGYVGRTCVSTPSGCFPTLEMLETNTGQRMFDALPIQVTDDGEVLFRAHIEGMPDIPDIFVRQVCLTGSSGCVETTARVSVPPSGLFSQTGSWTGAISADGDTVLLVSSSSDLVPDDSNGFDDIFLAPLIQPLPGP